MTVQVTSGAGTVILADAYATFADAVTALSAGGTLMCSAKTYDVGAAETFDIPSNSTVRGAGPGATIFRKAASPTTPTFKVDAKSNVRLEGFSCTKISGTATGTAYGVSIVGPSTDVLVQDVVTDGLVRGVHIGGEDGTASSANEVQVVKLSGTPTGGNFKLGVRTIPDNLQTTADIAHNASAANVLSALEALSNVGVGDMTVTGSAGGPWTITAAANLAGIPIDIFTFSHTLTGGTSPAIVVYRTTRGGETAQRITLRRVQALNHGSTSATAGFGFNIDDADEVILDDCTARGNFLDGVKARKRTSNVKLIGGNYSENGVGHITDPYTDHPNPHTEYAGDGIDAYSGGDTLTIIGSTFERNYGSGLVIKSSDAVGVVPETFGYVRNVQLTNVIARDNLVGGGLYVSLDSPQAIVSNLTITGGIYSRNRGASGDGMYIEARNFVISGAIIAENARYGMYVAPASFDGMIMPNIYVANGQLGAGVYDNLSIGAATRIKVMGGTFVGKEDADVETTTDLAAATAITRQAISVADGAADIVLDLRAASFTGHTASQPVLVNMTSGACLVNQVGTGNPNSNSNMGSLGSVYVRTDGSGYLQQYIRTSGNPNTTGSGWSSIPIQYSANSYTASNVSTDRAYDANATTLDEVADVLGTLIADLKTAGVIT